MAKQGELAKSGTGRGGASLDAALAAHPPGLTVAHFTEQELNELRRVVRDADSELGRRYLEAGLARASRPVVRPVDGMAG